jgi:ABC-type transport system substrate-binding protein
MKARLSLLLAASSIVLQALPAFTARRPRYGGTLVIELGARVNSADPNAARGNADEARAKEQIDSLIYAQRNPDGTFSGAGPFRVEKWDAGKEVELAANEQFDGGRAFVDAIEIRMGRTAKDRLIDLELGKADLAEIPADQARRATQAGIRVSRSQPDELIALAFDRRRGPGDDPRVREAVAATIDREAIVDFILQKGGEAAGGLLPQWSSGTAFLFSTAPDRGHAKELWSEISAPSAVSLGYDAGDSQEQAIAERIEVDAQGAGIAMKVEPLPSSAAESNVDARLVRLGMDSGAPQDALAHFLDALNPLTGLNLGGDALTDSAGPEQIYDAESGVVGSFAVVPIAWIPQVYGLSNRLRDWTAPGPGEAWPVENVWLDNIDRQTEKGSS